MKRSNPMTPLLLCGVFALAGCTDSTGEQPAAAPHDDHDHEHGPTNHLDVPEAVRRNLGLQFHTVGRRQVAATLRLPGHFELLPQGRRDHRMPLAGRVELRVAPLAEVALGDVLFTIDSPTWRQTQHELAELQATIEVTETRLAALEPLIAAHERHEESLREATAVLQRRASDLERTRAEVGGQAAELAAAQVQLAQTRAATTEAAEQHSETMALRAELGARRIADRERFRLLLATARSQLGLTVEQLLTAGGDGKRLWQTLDTIEVRAQMAGVVTTIADSNGAWLQAGDHVLELVDPLRLRFVGTALQSDLRRLAAGQFVRVVAPTSGTGSDVGLPGGTGRLQLGALADPAQRTIGVAVELDAVPAWARDGIAAFAEIETATSGPGVLAVPLAAIVDHGLSKVLFLRNPNDPDEVLRIEADLGVDDGRWVEVKSGITDGDEIVVAGAYALVLASAPQLQGGHFHADGTFHADDDHK